MLTYYLGVKNRSNMYFFSFPRPPPPTAISFSLKKKILLLHKRSHQQIYEKKYETFLINSRTMWCFFCLKIPKEHTTKKKGKSACFRHVDI